jgi:hypothetical protein
MTLHPTTPAAQARADAYRLRLSSHAVHACRHCREAVRVSSARNLPEVCPGCGAIGRDMWIPVGGERPPRAL